MTTTMDKPTNLESTIADATGWTDEELLVRYRESGDAELFQLLTGRYEREIYSY